MLFSAKLLGELFIKIKQPAIIGEIIAGVILGPTVLGMIFPSIFLMLFPKSHEISIALESFTTIAVVLLLLISGLEVDLAMVLRQGKKAIYTSNMGLAIPFALGFGVSYLFPNIMGIGSSSSSKFIFALFMGTALSISALPVIAKTLIDLKIFKLEIGVIIISAAMLNDLIGWLIFSVILGLIGTNNHGFTSIETMVSIIVFVLFSLTLGKKILNKIIPYINTNFTFPGGILSFVLILGFLGAAFTEYIGIHAIFGAFIVGIAIGNSNHLAENTKEIIHQFVTHIFAPLFFVSIGLKVNFIENFDFVIVSIILVLSFFGKVVGCGLGAYWSGLSKNDSLIIGFGMNSRGTMEIILGLIALHAGIINNQVFVALVIMALITSISSAPIMSYFLSKKVKFKLSNLLVEKYVAFTSEKDKEAIIMKLVNMVTENSKLNKTEIYNEVMVRENLVPTGISNYLAIPHAKINIKEPVLAVAINREGINFEASDGILSNIIILLLTPKNNNELQLKLLSEIVNKFTNKEDVEKLLTIESPKLFIDMLNEIK
ncbi:MAG: cation:proton antiporter [Ignavibacteriae bacterium]|nr:cation:proton antiporter [Ignavibacteriota bacterium]MCB0752644.1 cation:proton antiporter [Ignavibacteriota bacterium]